MSKSLSEMQTSPDVGRVVQTFDICVAGKLAAQLAAADKKFFDLTERAQTARQQYEDEKERGKPTRAGSKPEHLELERQAQEAAAQSDAIRERMAEHTITLELVTSEGWRAWTIKHPARDPEVDRTGARRDQMFARGGCNIDDLIEDLGTYVAKYGDEDPTDGSWPFVRKNASPGDLTRCASTVVQMHEQTVDLGKSRLAWLSDRMSETDSE
jgi:hypothetical protein